MWGLWTFAEVDGGARIVERVVSLFASRETAVKAAADQMLSEISDENMNPRDRMRLFVREISVHED